MRRPSLSEIEHGRREVRALELEGLADLYQVSTRLLTYGVGPKHEQLVRLVAEVLTPLHSQDLDLLARAIQIVKARRA